QLPSYGSLWDIRFDIRTAPTAIVFQALRSESQTSRTQLSVLIMEGHSQAQDRLEESRMFCYPL
ncbi:MAG: hypothetical protein JWO91_1759, partial [Acidobacteriaceae bacterium]|nr:hypothetical protein [Acidobacteriaceae bacterium]